MKHFCPNCQTELAKVKGTKSTYKCPQCGFSANFKRINELARFFGEKEAQH